MDALIESIKKFGILTPLVIRKKKMGDDGRIAFCFAVEISYPNENDQRALLNAIGSEDATPSFAQAIELKKGGML